jgi:heme-degrading monooxygenase HmoA
MVLVVIETQVAPASETLLLNATRDRFDFPRGRVPGRRWSRVFQGVDDTTAFLFLAHWDSREAFEQAFDARQAHLREPALLQVSRPRFFQSLVAFERVMVPIAARSVILIEGSAAVLSSMRTYLLDLFETHRESQPGLVNCIIGEEIAAPPTLLLVNSWQTSAGLDAARASMTTEFVTTVAAAGATFHRYQGVAINVA